MKPDTRQSGFTLISTLFLLLVVATLGAYMVRLSTAQHVSSALGVNALRAHYAAESGMEWAKYRITHSGLCPSVGSSVSLEGFTVSVQSCSLTLVTEGAATYSLFDIQVEARRGAWGQAEYARRRLRATLKI